MSQTEFRIVPQTVESILVLRLTGPLTEPDVPATRSKLADATAVLPPPPLVVLDLREVPMLAAAGVRMLAEFVRRQADDGVQVAAVLDDDSAAARPLQLALSSEQLPRYPTVDAAIPAGHLARGSDDDVADQLAALTRVLLDADTVEQALRQVVSATIVVIPHAQVVSVTLRDPAGRFFTPIETDGVAGVLDQVQYATGHGPCVDIAKPDTPGYVLVQDLSGPTDWPQFSAAAAGRGFGSVLSTAIQPTSGVSGALNIYSHRDGITDNDRHRALLLATHASLVLARTHAAEIARLHEVQLHRAIDSRDVIGQAKGILMARQGITADEAFALLRRTSQDLNVKLTEIAGTLVGRHTELDPPTP